MHRACMAPAAQQGVCSHQVTQAPSCTANRHKPRDMAVLSHAAGLWPCVSVAMCECGHVCVRTCFFCWCCFKVEALLVRHVHKLRPPTPPMPASSAVPVNLQLRFRLHLHAHALQHQHILRTSACNHV